jgi:hypothetical protein
MADKFCRNLASSTPNATNLQHGTDGFTYPPKEGMLKIFSGLNPRSWVPEGSMLTTTPLKQLGGGLRNVYIEDYHNFMLVVPYILVTNVYFIPTEYTIVKALAQQFRTSQRPSSGAQL